MGARGLVLDKTTPKMPLRSTADGFRLVHGRRGPPGPAAVGRAVFCRGRRAGAARHASRAGPRGHEAIIAFMDAQQGVLRRIKHTIRRVDILPQRVYEEAGVEWVVKGDPEGRVIAGRGLGVFDEDCDEDRVRRFDVYADFSALVARCNEVHAGGP